MGQRRNAKSVRNFVIFLLILQNCGQARTQPPPEIELEQEQESKLQQRRDGLAKFEFSGKQLEQDEGPASGRVVPAASQNVFNFAKICETFYAQLMRTAADADEQRGRGRGHANGRGLRNPQAQLMWETEPEGEEQVVLVTSPKPVHVVDQLHQILEEQRKRKHMSTVKPLSVLQQLAMEQGQRPNGSFNIMEALQMEQDKWEKRTSTVKPFRVVQQLQQELEELQKHTTTVKPFSVLEHLTLQQAEELRKKKTSNISFNLLEALHMEQEKLEQQRTTVKPFHLATQLNQELEKHEQGEGQGEEEEEEAFEVLQPGAEPLEEHKAVPAESTRAKDSQKRKRKRIRRRRKRIQKRRKRKRRKNRKKRKKKRKKRKKKQGDKDKKKKRKKRRKKPTEATGIIGQPAHLIYANPTKQPYHSHNYPHPHPHPQQPQVIQIVTTKRPSTTPAPFSKIKYLLRHNTLFKKKKKEWFNHVGHVLYPFVKFVAFFTVLNPFTLGVFLFTLISPAVFGFLGFVALSVLVKPFLHLVFGVKDTVSAIDRRRYLANKRAEQLKLNLRPVTIHKHYYQQKPLHSTPPHRYRPLADWRRQAAPHPAERRHNPLLPADRTALAHL
ncbi:hypothetical protein ACLKA7_015967 [Drosophila subpalustris]